MKTSPPVFFGLILGLTLAGFVMAAEPVLPLLKTLGSHSRKVTTTSPEAQRYFDQGLRFVYGFNHGAAIRSFQEAARLDPQCAMAHWGIALAPFALVLALSIWGYGRYAWIPFAAAILCPVGAVLTAMQVRRDDRRA